MGDGNAHLLKERNRVNVAHSPTLACRKNLVFEKLTIDINENCVSLEECRLKDD